MMMNEMLTLFILGVNFGILLTIIIEHIATEKARKDMIKERNRNV